MAAKAAVVIHTNFTTHRRGESLCGFVFQKVRPALRVLISLEKFKKDFMKDGDFSEVFLYNELQCVKPVG